MSANDRYNTARLIAGDKTPEFNHNYFPIAVVSDGGSAVILKKNMTKRRILGVEVATLGKLHDMWFIPGIHNRDPKDIGGKFPRKTCTTVICKKPIWWSATSMRSKLGVLRMAIL